MATVNPGARSGPDRDLATAARRLACSTVAVHSSGGMGSGVIWSPDGLVVTNAHVARGDSRIALDDGRVLIGRLIAADPERDLAVLAVEANDMRAAEVGDSDRLRVGQLVITIGHPHGIAGALAIGMVHATAANARFIRTTLRLAPGNSGGPLAVADGRVIGVNTMIAGGLALAVPSKTVARFCASLGRAASVR